MSTLLTLFKLRDVFGHAGQPRGRPWQGLGAALPGGRPHYGPLRACRALQPFAIRIALCALEDWCWQLRAEPRCWLRVAGNHPALLFFKLSFVSTWLRARPRRRCFAPCVPARLPRGMKVQAHRRAERRCIVRVAGQECQAHSCPGRALCSGTRNSTSTDAVLWQLHVGCGLQEVKCVHGSLAPSWCRSCLRKVLFAPAQSGVAAVVAHCLALVPYMNG